jgi:hypothetical protein
MEPAYNRNEEWHQTARLIPAVIVIGIGVLFLLNNLHIIWIRNWMDYWPVILIAIGLEKLVDSSFSGGRVTGGILMGAGGLFLARNLGYLDLRMRDLWPLVLIGVGLLMLWNRTPWAGPVAVRTRLSTAANSLNDTVVFSGIKRNITTTDFQGGHITAIFGGADLNLRRASMVGDSAVLEVDAVFGGAEVKIPETWSVVMQGSGIFGGFTDETVQPRHDTPGLKKLYIRGSAVFGGVAVKN